MARKKISETELIACGICHQVEPYVGRTAILQHKMQEHDLSQQEAEAYLYPFEPYEEEEEALLKVRLLAQELEEKGLERDPIGRILNDQEGKEVALYAAYQAAKDELSYWQAKSRGFQITW